MMLASGKLGRRIPSIRLSTRLRPYISRGRIG